jgi:phage terminase large subunit GpA-like protein
MPTEDLARFISRNRIWPMVESCQKLREKKPEDPDEYQRLEMKFKGMVLSIIGANSPASLSHRPVRFLLRDETNKFPFFAAKEADPMSLSKERTKNFWNRKIFDVSTPSTENGAITKELESCDVVFDFHVPCPHCGVYQILQFDQIKWPKKEKDDESITPDEARRTAWLECEACKQSIADVYKNEMLRAGEWRSRGEKSTEFGRYILDHHPRKVGFHLPAWYSPWLKWGDCAAEFLSSKDFPEKLMNFKNSWEALPWLERFESKTVSELFENRVDLSPLVCPKDTVALTCGIDPSSGGFWFTVLGWRSDMSCHLIHYGFIVGWEAVTSLIWESSYAMEDNS